MLFSSEESRLIDSKTIQDFGFSSFTLMETAALGVSGYIREKHGEKKSGLFLCGKGNNAGDALASARHLADKSNHSIDLYFPLGKDGLSDDTSKNYTLLSRLKNHGLPITILEESEQPDFQKYDYVVDGLFGTGISRDIEGNLYDVIDTLNKLEVTVYSMDIPSGLNGDSGKVFGICVKADVTFTFGTRKIGLYLENARKFTGSVRFIPLQFPTYYLNKDTFLLNRDLYNSISAGNRDARHKYEQGVVHVIAGSEGLTGAAITACRSAWKNGAGAVFLYAPEKLLPVYEITLPEVIKIPVGESNDACFKESHTSRIIEQIESKPGVLLAGPGIGTEPDTQKCLSTILTHYKGMALIDADALSLWNELKVLAETEENEWLFTPHMGEAANYMEADFSGDLNRLNWADKISTEHNCSIIMKGNPTFLTTPISGRFITGYNTSMFSKAGFGDQLAGAVAAQAAIRNNIADAALYVLYNSYLQYLSHNSDRDFTPGSLL